MSEKPSFWCSSFSRFWWWLLALLGLPLLLFLMNHFQQAKIESDLAERVSAALSAENIDWVEVDVQKRGRDVLLKGEPENDAERERALQLAQGVYGVNQVDFAGDYLPAATEQSDEGEDSADKAGMDEADQDSVSASASDDNDNADAETEQDATAGDEEMALANDTDAEDAAEDKEETLLPAELTMKMDGEQLVLDGKMASQQQIDTLQQAATRQVGVTKVVNNLKVNEAYAEADWVDGVAKMIAALPADGGVQVNADTLQLSGEVSSDAEAQQLAAQAQQMLQGSGLQLQNSLRVAVPPEQSDPQQQAAAKAEECQIRMNAALQDKKILFTFNDSTINNESNALLDNLAQIIGECSDAMGDRVIVIGGHTDSVGRDAYNLELSQRRADSVREYLKARQIDEALLEARGFGEAQPVAPNNTAAGQARNRRITFEIKQK